MNKAFTFDGFVAGAEPILNVVIGVCIFAVIVTIAIGAMLGHKDPEKRGEFITALTWVVIIAFVLGAGSTIVKLIWA